MYKVLIDGLVAYKPGSKSYSLLKAELDLQTGFAGRFTFTVPPSNPIQSRVKTLTSIVQVFRDETEIFYGSVRNMTNCDRYKNKTYEALSSLSWLSDSVQPQAEFHNKTVRQFLESLIAEHNAKVENLKKFTVGTVTVTDSNDSLYRFTNYESTLEAIRDKLVDRLGGALRVRHVGSTLYLDYVEIDEYGKHSTQPIEFGLNLLDYSETLTSDDIITALIPLGAVLEDETGNDGQEERFAEVLDKRVDIKTVNSGKDYLLNQTAINNFGYIWQVATWDDVTLPANLKAKGQEYLTSKQFEDLTLQLKAADLSDLGQDFEAFAEGDLITCKAKPYGMDTVLPVMALTINLLDPAGNSLTLTKQKKETYTAANERRRGQASTKLSEVRRIQTSALKSAQDNITSMMTGSLGGYRVTEYDDAGRWLRDLYLNTPDPETATRVLQINKDGIGGSTNGINGPYSVGMTIDGQIVGGSITAGSVAAEKLSVEYRAEVTQAIDDAESNAKADTTEKLKNYVTQSKLTADLNGVKAEVTKYTDDSLKDYVTSAALKVKTDSIETEVSKKVGSSEIISKINQSAEGIKISASKFDIDASAIRLKATTLQWDSTYSSLSSTGKLKAQSAELSGTLKAGSSSGYWVELAGSGRLTGGYGSSQYGYIDYSASSTNTATGVTDHGIQIQGGCLRISTRDISVAATSNVSTTTTICGTGWMRVVYNMASDMSSCNETSYHFINGLLCSSL